MSRRHVEQIRAVIGTVCTFLVKHTEKLQSLLETWTRKRGKHLGANAVYRILGNKCEGFRL